MDEAIRFDHFFPYDELVTHLHAIAARRPDLIEVVSIGKSYEGRDIWCATVTNGATGAAAEKPAVWIDGNIHATEVSASSACIYFLNRLASEHGVDETITRCLDTRAFYVVPRFNPDGPERYFAPEQRFLRSSVRPYPFDEEPFEGLERRDLDGDGRMLSMRVPDPNGGWKVDHEDPRLMVRRDPTEVGGTYYRVLPEGLIENFDGVTVGMRGTKEGLDLNRNFPGHWRPENEQYGAGPYPTSEPEVRAVVDFLCSHRNIVSAFTFHTFSGVLLRPYGTQNDESMPAEDLWTYQAIGKKGTEITGYPAISVYHDFRYHPKEVITGVFDDWLFDHFGIYAWTVEIWCPQRQAGIQDYKPILWERDHPVQDDRQMLKWNDDALAGRGYVEWKAFDHPQLGPVEIGGWDMQYAFRNPPPPLLEKEIGLFPDWLIWNALITPRLNLLSAEAVQIGECAYRIRVVVENDGWLPTYGSKQALARKASRGLVAEISLPESCAMELGKVRTESGELEGRGSDFGWPAGSTSDRAKIEWVVRGPAGSDVEVSVRHDRAGVVRARVSLP